MRHLLYIHKPETTRPEIVELTDDDAKVLSSTLTLDEGEAEALFGPVIARVVRAAARSLGGGR